MKDLKSEDGSVILSVDDSKIGILGYDADTNHYQTWIVRLLWRIREAFYLLVTGRKYFYVEWQPKDKEGFAELTADIISTMEEK